MYWNRKNIVPLLLKLAKYALQVQGNIKAKNKKIDKTVDIITEADLVVEKMCCEYLGNLDKTCKVLGEENFYQYMKSNSHETIKNDMKGTMYIIDPIDGTLNYYNKLPQWAIGIALIVDGEFKEGAIVLPSMNELIISENSKVYYADINFSNEIQEYEIQYSTVSNSNRNNIDEYSIFSRSCEIEEFFPNTKTPYHVNRCTIFNLAKVILGQYWGTIEKAKIWDLASGIAIFRNLGYSVHYIDKNKIEVLPYTIDEKHWGDNFTQARYNMIFTGKKILAEKFLVVPREVMK